VRFAVVVGFLALGCAEKSEGGGVVWSGDTGPMGPNQYPTAPEISLSPEFPDTSTDLAVAVTTPSIDSDGDPIEYRYSWSRDGDSRTDLSEDTVSNVFTRRGEVWRVEVVAHDGRDSGAEATAEVTIQNSLPTIESVFIEPGEIYENTEVTCVVGETADADHDPVGVRTVWVLDDEELEQEGPLTGTDFDRGQTLVCRAYLEDGVDYPPPVDSDPVTVRNTPPNIVGVSLSDNNPPTDSNVEAIPDGWFDDDGDEEGYLYTWYLNGIFASSEPILTAERTARGDNVYVELIAFDGIDEGNMVQSSYGTVIEASSDTSGD
jgi:hypothetical protein